VAVAADAGAAALRASVASRDAANRKRRSRERNLNIPRIAKSTYSETASVSDVSKRWGSGTQAQRGQDRRGEQMTKKT
jgi:hypothetical protein